MPRPAKGARLWLEPEERDASGKLIHRAAWVIRDGARKSARAALEATAKALNEPSPTTSPRKYQAPRESGRHPAQILVLDVLNIYASDAVPKHKRTKRDDAAIADARRFSRLAHACRCQRQAMPRLCRVAHSRGNHRGQSKPDTRRGWSAQRRRGVNWKICGPRSTITARKGCVPRSSAWCCPRKSRAA